MFFLERLASLAGHFVAVKSLLGTEAVAAYVACDFLGRRTRSPHLGKRININKGGESVVCSEKGFDVKSESWRETCERECRLAIELYHCWGEGHLATTGYEYRL